MPINVFGNSFSSNENGDQNDTSLIVQKPYLLSNFIECIFEEGADLKNQNRIRTLPDPISIREAAPKNFLDNKFNDPSMIKSNNPHPE